jgi:hypothetical protein
VADREGKVVQWSAGVEKRTGLRQDVLGRWHEAELVENENGESAAPAVLKTNLPLEPTHHGILSADLISLRCKMGTPFP